MNWRLTWHQRVSFCKTPPFQPFVVSDEPLCAEKCVTTTFKLSAIQQILPNSNVGNIFQVKKYYRGKINIETIVSSTFYFKGINLKIRLPSARITTGAPHPQFFYFFLPGIMTLQSIEGMNVNVRQFVRHRPGVRSRLRCPKNKTTL